MKEYEGNMTEYVENMKEYVKNIKKYVKNMKEYEEICQYIGFSTPISIWALGLGKLPRPSFLLGSGTVKDFKLCLYIGLYRLWDLEKFHAGASS